MPCMQPVFSPFLWPWRNCVEHRPLARILWSRRKTHNGPYILTNRVRSITEIYLGSITLWHTVFNNNKNHNIWINAKVRIWEWELRGQISIETIKINKQQPIGRRKDSLFSRPRTARSSITLRGFWQASHVPFSRQGLAVARALSPSWCHVPEFLLASWKASSLTA